MYFAHTIKKSRNKELSFCARPQLLSKAFQTVCNSRLVEVFSGSRWEAELIKGLLESNEIAAALKDGLITTIAPYISPTVSVMVTEDCYEPAMEIIRNREKAEND